MTVVKTNCFAILEALEGPPPVLSKHVFEVDTNNHVRIAAAIGLAAALSPA